MKTVQRSSSTEGTLYPLVLFKLSIVMHVIVSSLFPVYVDILANFITPKMDVRVLLLRLIGLASDQLWLVYTFSV